MPPILCQTTVSFALLTVPPAIAPALLFLLDLVEAAAALADEVGLSEPPEPPVEVALRAAGQEGKLLLSMSMRPSERAHRDRLTELRHTT